MAIWRVNSGASAEWIANHAYSLGDRCVCTSAYATTARRKYVWECTTAGTSHATTQPVWPDGPVGQTVADNDVVWTCRLPNDGIWANATCYLGYILSSTTPVAAGEAVYIHYAHAENKDWGAAYYYLYGTATGTNPIKIFSVDKDDSDTLRAGALVSRTGAGYSIGFRNYAYSWGIQYKSVSNLYFGYGGTSCWIIEGDGSMTVLYGNSIWFQTDSYLKVINGDIYVNSGSYGGFVGSTAGGFLHWKKGTLQIATSPSGSYLFDAPGGPFKVKLEDIDLSQMSKHAATYYLQYVNRFYPWHIEIHRCKLPASNFGFSPKNYARILNGRLNVHHCSSENKYYDFYEEDEMGAIQDEITIVRTGGASDGTTPQSWKMVSSAAALETMLALESPPIHIWGAYAVEKTFTVEGIWDSAANIQTDEIWMELEYPADASSGQGAVSRVKCAPLGTPSDVPASTAEWTTSGMTNPNKFKFQATVTPGKEGPVTARIYLAKPSTTVYIDPLITVS